MLDGTWPRLPEHPVSTPQGLAPRHEMVFRVSTITTSEELAALAGEWIRLLERTKNDLPFLLPEWLVTWWESFRQEGLLIRDSLRVKIVRDGAGTLVGVVPLMSTDRPAFGPMRSRALGFVGADRHLTELRAPIVDPSCPGHVARALAGDVLADDTWDWITWQGLDRESEFARELERLMPLQWGPTETGNVLTLAPSWDEFKRGLKRNIKESLRRCYNSLDRDGFTPRVVVAETPEDIEKGLAHFYRLHSMRADQTKAVIHPDRFAADGARRFLDLVCARLSERRAARVFTLMVGDAPVASRVGFMLPRCLYLYYSGFDPAWGKYSVATTTVAEAIKYAIGIGVPTVHLSMGSDVSKSRWGPRTSVHHQAFCVRPRLSSRAALKVYTWARQNASLEGPIGRLIPKRRFD
jgi:CelD/BcsL family acetyltransferase involved in cellulose biosynthesis